MEYKCEDHVSRCTVDILLPEMWNMTALTEKNLEDSEGKGKYTSAVWHNPPSVFGPSDQEQPSGNNGWGAVAFDLRSMRLSGHKCATAGVCKPQSFWGGCLSSNISSTVRISVYPCSIKLKMVKSEAAWLVMCVEWNTFKDLQDLTEILRKWQWPSCQPRRVCLI